MTTHDRDKVIAAAKEADPGINEQTVDFLDEDGIEKLERFYAIAFEAGRQAEREECAKYIENQSLPDAYSEPCLAEFAKEIRARGDRK